MSKNSTVIKVWANENDFDISFNEERLEALGPHKIDMLMLKLLQYANGFRELHSSREKHEAARLRWASVNSDEFDDDIPF